MTSYDYDKDNRPKEVVYSRPAINNTQVEYFPLNDTTTGSRGTTAVEQNAEYKSDETGKPVFSANAGTKVLYNLGISKNSGAEFTWFSTTGGDSRYIIANEGSNGEAIIMYVGTDNKLKLAVKNNAGTLVDIASTNEIIASSTWYYGGFKWQLNGSTLKCTLYIKDAANTLKGYTASITDFKDFTGAQTALGSSTAGANVLNGYMEQFSYSGSALSEFDIAKVYGSGRGTRVSYTYDSLGRISGTTVNTGKSQYNTVYSYVPGVNGSSTDKIQAITNNGSTITYTYDANGNIETITQNGTQIRYYYNELNELIREDNQVLDKTIVYAYDAGGNFTSKIEYAYITGTPSNPVKTYSYAYDSTWKDKLTNFDGNAISYDEIGNPLSYDGWTYNWEEGRQLASISKTGLDIFYKYNDQGIRTEKTVNGVSTKYHLVGDKVTYETNGIDKIYYTYDSADMLVSMNLNGKEYYYIRNAQGDITGLFDDKGVQVVTYTYDTWGNPVSITGSLASTVGIENPYRYRGYRYDAETGLFYLQSRYYSPEWGRFINVDDTNILLVSKGTLANTNLFAYCNNNPIMEIDPYGYRSSRRVNAVRGAIVSGANAVAGAIATGARAVVNNGIVRDTVIGAVAGATGGATSGVVAGLFGAPITAGASLPVCAGVGAVVGGTGGAAAGLVTGILNRIWK